MTQLLHLGLSYNTLTNILPGQQWLPSQLISLDLGYNHLYNLKETLDSLTLLKNLKNLVLIGNPICLVKAYTSSMITMLNLYSLDDQVIQPNQKESLKKQELKLDESFVDILWTVSLVTGVRKPPNTTTLVADQPPPEYLDFFLLKLNLQRTF